MDPEGMGWLPCASEQKREGHAWIVSLSMSCHLGLPVLLNRSIETRVLG